MNATVKPGPRPGAPPRPLQVPSHGAPLRGPQLPGDKQKPHKLFLIGFFGKMLHLAATKFRGGALAKLGTAMTVCAFDPSPDQRNMESGIPSLYTYFGQFVDHDITFDPNSHLQKVRDPTLLEDFRTPALDLDSVYGRGPKDQPYLYTKPQVPGGIAHCFLLGSPLNSGFFGATDLPRNGDDPARALIGDPRNDQNVITSQLHVLFLMFHNRLASAMRQPSNHFLNFSEVVREVQFHYQHIVLYDYLPKIVHKDVLKTLKGSDGKHYDPKKIKFFREGQDSETNEAKRKDAKQEKDPLRPHEKIERVTFPFMPIEFSVAAYRFGHSMVRQDYQLNSSTLHPIVSVTLIGPNGRPEQRPGLEGFQHLDPGRGIDWARFINTEALNDDDSRRLQFALRIDTSLVNPFLNLPTSIVNDNPDTLASRNLIRGNDMGLPSGQDAARAMGEKVLRDDQIRIGEAKTPITSIHSSFAGRCPLWTYILAEAMHHTDDVKVKAKKRKVKTPKLGPVGGRIVAEVILGLMAADEDSVLNDKTGWKPNAFAPDTPKKKNDEDYTLADFVRFATAP